MLIGTILFFMLVLVTSNNFVVFYIALEGVSLLSFVLKYFFQSSLASILLLAGVALLFASIQDFDFMQIRYILSEQLHTGLTHVSVLLITVALLFKVSAFPGHF